MLVRIDNSASLGHPEECREGRCLVGPVVFSLFPGHVIIGRGGLTIQRCDLSAEFRSISFPFRSNQAETHYSPVLPSFCVPIYLEIREDSSAFLRETLYL